jgi:hypothetical protein
MMTRSASPSASHRLRIPGPDSAGDVIANLCMDDPDDYHVGWESESFSESSERATIVVQEIAGNPEYWRWDGSAEALRR